MRERRAETGGAPLQTLRDKGHLTRLLILRELTVTPGATLSAIGERLGVTVQAISLHVRALERAGHLAPRRPGEGHALTPAGRQILLEGFARLKRAVDDALTPLARVEVASALARTPIRAGERVGLFMEAGELVARARAASASTGIAVEGAMADEEVVIRDLSGFVDLKPGRVWIVRVPSPAEGGSRRVNLRRLRADLKAHGAVGSPVGAVGAGALALARRLDLAVDFRFAAPEASFNAAELGLSPLLLVQRDRLADVLAILDERNRSTIQRVPIEMIDAHPAETPEARA